MKAFQKLQTLEDENRFVPWLYIIARNVAADYWPPGSVGARKRAPTIAETFVLAQFATSCVYMALHLMSNLVYTCVRCSLSFTFYSYFGDIVSHVLLAVISPEQE